MVLPPCESVSKGFYDWAVQFVPENQKSCPPKWRTALSKRTL